MRSKRVEFEGAIYHVMQRGNNKESIFQSDKDKYFFLNQLDVSKKKFNFLLFGYVLMDNHYHLLIQVNKFPLSKVMQRQNSIYSRYYNRTQERSGHLFGLRYKASLVLDDSYLFAVLRYIHWNPIRAGLSKNVFDYKWCSDSYYRNGRNGLVDVDFLFSIISQKREYALEEYVRLMQVDGQQQNKDFRFISEEIDFNYAKVRAGALIDRSLTLDEILIETGVNETQFKDIKAGSRKRDLIPYKRLYVELASEEGYKLKEIAESIGVTVSAASKLAK
ncbi:MAG: transposase [Bacillota bacterium]|nr:transposase [Bacillota bacterium]MDW7730354.1 transposase [Bacillota bacterium]